MNRELNLHRYTARDYLHFARFYWRGRRRQQRWSAMFEASVRDESFKLPSAAVVQFIPTEACNLRCPFCNQWGDAGYFRSGARKVESMNSDSITSLIEKLSPHDSMINVHGGEPFAYKHIDSLLERVGRARFRRSDHDKRHAHEVSPDVGSAHKEPRVYSFDRW